MVQDFVDELVALTGAGRHITTLETSSGQVEREDADAAYPWII